MLLMSAHRRCSLAGFVIGIFISGPLFGAEVDQQPAEQNPEFQSGFDDVPQFGGPDGVSGQLRESDRARESTFQWEAPQRWFEPWFDWKGRVQEDYGVALGFFGSTVYQNASDVQPGRDDDALGLGFSTGVNGDKFKRAQENAGDPVTDSEAELILVYSAKVTRWLVLQPVVQYYIAPGTDPAADNAFVLGVRIGVLL